MSLYECIRYFVFISFVKCWSVTGFHSVTIITLNLSQEINSLLQSVGAEVTTIGHRQNGKKTVTFDEVVWWQMHHGSRAIIAPHIALVATLIFWKLWVKMLECHCTQCLWQHRSHDDTGAIIDCGIIFHNGVIGLHTAQPSNDYWMAMKKPLDCCSFRFFDFQSRH